MYIICIDIEVPSSGIYGGFVESSVFFEAEFSPLHILHISLTPPGMCYVYGDADKYQQVRRMWYEGVSLVHM